MRYKIYNGGVLGFGSIRDARQCLRIRYVFELTTVRAAPPRIDFFSIYRR